MTRKTSAAQRKVPAAILAGLLLFSSAASAADLQSKTKEAFQRYVQLTEAQMDAQIARRDLFLWVDRLPDSRRFAAHAQLRDGKVVVEKLETLDNGKGIPLPDGILHHWIGTVFIPGATLSHVLAIKEDYDHEQDFFRPEVERSKLLRRNGDDFFIYLRFRKKKIVTSVVDTWHEVYYERVDATHAWSRSHTTRVQEVEDAGKPDERLLPEGHDHGYLWAIDTYWRFEEKDGGTYVECQALSLSRDIPTGLGWLIGPFVTSIPRESLTFTLTTTRSAVLARFSAPTPR